MLSQEKLVSQQELFVSFDQRSQGNLAGMAHDDTIHSRIKAHIARLGWSLNETAQQIRDIEEKLTGRPSRLSYQAVQQWLKEGGTAPKRARLEATAKAFGTTVPELVAGVSDKSSDLKVVQPAFSLGLSRTKRISALLGKLHAEERDRFFSAVDFLLSEYEGRAAKVPRVPRPGVSPSRAASGRKRGRGGGGDA